MSDTAEELMESALQAVVKIDRAACKSLTYTQIASGFLDQAKKNRCLDILVEALRTADSVKQPEEKAKILARIARIYTLAGNRKKADELFTRAILLARATATTAIKFDTLYSIVCECSEAGLNDEAGKILSELHDIVIFPDKGLDVACELINIAEIYSGLGQTDKASEILEQALNLTSGIKDNWFKAERLIGIAGGYTDAGYTNIAIKVLNEAFSVVNQISETNRPYFLLKLADLLIDMDREPVALETLTSALGIVNENEEIASKSDDLIAIAEAYQQVGDKPASIKLLYQILEIARRTKKENDKISIMFETADAFRELGEPEKAQEIARQAHDLCIILEDKRTAIFLMGSLAILFVQLNSRDKAAEIIDKIVEMVHMENIKTTGLGEISKDLAEAGEIRLAIQLARPIREPHIQAEALYSIAKAIRENNQ